MHFYEGQTERLYRLDYEFKDTLFLTRDHDKIWLGNSLCSQAEIIIKSGSVTHFVFNQRSL